MESALSCFVEFAVHTLLVVLGIVNLQFVLTSLMVLSLVPNLAIEVWLPPCWCMIIVALALHSHCSCLRPGLHSVVVSLPVAVKKSGFQHVQV